jgi:hypothetical protein
VHIGILFVAIAACSSGSSSGGSTDSGATGDGGCLLATPTKGAPCSGTEVLCNPGDFCCTGEWVCDANTHTWNLLQGKCACVDAAPPNDTGASVDSASEDTTTSDAGDGG